MIRAALGAVDRRHMRKQGGPHVNTLRIYGTYRCSHRSHALRLPCLRYWTWDTYCGKHNGTCWNGSHGGRA